MKKIREFEKNKVIYWFFFFIENIYLTYPSKSILMKKLYLLKKENDLNVDIYKDLEN